MIRRGDQFNLKIAFNVNCKRKKKTLTFISSFPQLVDLGETVVKQLTKKSTYLDFLTDLKANDKTAQRQPRRADSERNNLPQGSILFDYPTPNHQPLKQRPKKKKKNYAI